VVVKYIKYSSVFFFEILHLNLKSVYVKAVG